MKHGFFRFVVCVAIYGLFCGVGFAARADGSWVALRTEASGLTTASGNSVVRSNNNIRPQGSVSQPWRGTPYTPAPGQWWDDVEWTPDSGASAYAVSNGAAASANASGQVRTVFRWVTTTGASIPPMLTVKICFQAVGKAIAGNGYYNSGTHWPKPSVPDPSKQHATVSAWGVTASPVSNSYGLTADTSPLKRLAQIATNGQSEVAGPWVPFNASVSVDGGRYVQWTDEGGSHEYGYGGETDLILNYTSASDNRSVKITRPTIEPSYSRIGLEFLLPRTQSGIVGGIYGARAGAALKGIIWPKTPPPTPESPGGPNCFAAGTLVLMADGSRKRIELIKKVMSYSRVTHKRG